ncbi:IS4 family transposase, partial [Bradyrhizobium sp. SZCCHNS3051]|uniref:IS4 family transposase n=4 Tax=Bradyrhizobium TaxID=374 RepID=UPI002915E7A4
AFGVKPTCVLPARSDQNVGPGSCSNHGGFQQGMADESLLNEDWTRVVAQLGGAAQLEKTARQTKAFARRRQIPDAVTLLRLMLAYCLGERGLRSTAAWAASVGLADLTSVALFYRLRQCGDWFAVLVEGLLAAAAPKASQGRLIRIIDATTVPQAGPAARKNSELWRVHSAFDLPYERFGHFELTDQQEGETFDRIPVVKNEIRIADRAYLQPDRIAAVREAGADVLIRAGWKNARWLDAKGLPFDLMAQLRAAKARGLVDREIWIKRKGGAPLAMRLVAIKKPTGAAAASRRKARQDAKDENRIISKETLEAADWVILITSLARDEFSTKDVLALYRLRWRIELGFKRLKSLIGLKTPPGTDPRSAKPYLLAHLLIILLLEPLASDFEDSPHWTQAA